MALDLNMGYYTIRLDPDASRICTVIFPWGKYSIKRLPLGIAGYPDIFQSKMSELMEDLEYVQAYVDDLLCISRSSLEDHLKKLKEVLRRLHDVGLKVNAEKLTFCALEIEYLGYILTREGIKPQSNKLQAILVIQPPTNVKELRHLLGMVQYYCDFWARLHIPAGILRIPAFSVPVAFFSQESQFLFQRNFFRMSSGNLSVWGLRRKLCRISIC
jgi:hypothetical protein